jgi:thiol:disulfide interchange protein DsbD
LKPLRLAPVSTFLLAAALVVFVRAALAQDVPPPKPGELVKLAPVAAVHVAPGGAGEARLTFHVPAPWHVNAHKPNEDFLVPTVLTLVPASGVTAGAPAYPKAIQAKLSFSETPLAVYQGDFTISVPLSAAATAAPGAHALHGTLRFQSCNDQVCLPPATIPVTLPVVVAPAARVSATAPVDSVAHAAAPVDTAAPTAGAQAPPAVSANSGGSNPAASGGNLVSRWFDERGSLLAFVLIFLMGLALNLTPCVYPMMGVTISLFGGGMAGGAGGPGAASGGLRALPRALVYVLGIALMYSTLGVIAALTGGLFGGWLSNPWVLGGIGALLLAMALSMFGLYELQVPSAVLSRLGGAAGAGLFGTFLAGLMVGVFAAPCIGPPIIALLAHVGAKGDPVFGFWAFFVLSLGLGLPYLVLGVSTGLLARLPRSGSWMDWVKHLFGVVLLGVAAFYLCLAIAPARLGWVVPLALGVGGLYLGFLEPTGRDRPGFRRFKWAVGVAGIAAAAIVAFEAPAPAVAWQEFGEDALAQAKAAGKPVVLDFSAEWCVPCHELDDRTFSDADVAKALVPFVKLKVDLTRFDSPASLALRKRFDIQGVPTLVFLAADGHEVAEARSVGFVPPDALRAHAALALGGGLSARE